MNHAYTRRYEELHNLASKNKTNGRAINRTHRAVLDVENPTVIHCVGRVYIWMSKTNKCVPFKHCPKFTVISLDPNGMTIYGPSPNAEVRIAPEFAALYPDVEPRVYGPQRAADSGFNNFLSQLRPAFWHIGNRIRNKPGFKWYRGSPYQMEHLEGDFNYPLRYDAVSDKLTEINPPLVKKINHKRHNDIEAAIKVLFKRLAPLTKMGVDIKAEDVEQRFNEFANNKPDTNAFVVDFLHRAAAFDPRSHKETIDIVARAAYTGYILGGRRGFYQWNPALSRYDTLAESCLEAGSMHLAASRARLRNKLRAHFEVTKYVPGPVLASPSAK